MKILSIKDTSEFIRDVSHNTDDLSRLHSGILLTSGKVSRGIASLMNLAIDLRAFSEDPEKTVGDVEGVATEIRALYLNLVGPVQSLMCDLEDFKCVMEDLDQKVEIAKETAMEIKKGD